MFQPFILIMQVLALALLQVMHPRGMSGLVLHLTDLAFIPSAVLGTVIGVAVFSRLSDHHFGTAVNGLLLVAGLGLVL